jgi:hypothetical protein
MLPAAEYDRINAVEKIKIRTYFEIVSFTLKLMKVTLNAVTNK